MLQNVAMESNSIAPPSKAASTLPKPVQALPAKVFHWVNVVSLTIMMMSGLQIYNANPVFGGREGWHFPQFFLLGGWLAGGRHWHFAAMWVFSLNLLCYGIYILVTKRWQHRFVGGNDLKALRVANNSKRRVYAWHRLVYTSIFPVLFLAIFTGIGMYKPAQFPWIVDCFGDWFALRVVHFATVPMLLLFMVVHSLLALKAGSDRLVNSMFWDEMI